LTYIVGCEANQVDGVGLVWVEVPVGRVYQFKLQFEMELRIEVMRFHLAVVNIVYQGATGRLTITIISDRSPSQPVKVFV
jgi:hypothetical protein